ncbi:MAG TPA: endolytic transglycosylase MltG [Chitinophagales bacterium]|nr:endolytic transglycosylase MltG [Chitinophagales bacterium]
MAIKRKTVIIVAVIIAFLGIIGVGSGYTVYLRVMVPNVAVQEDVSLYVKPTFNLDSILVQTQKLQLFKNEGSFEWWAKRQNLGNNLVAGRYVITPGMSNRAIVNLLMSGRQTPVNVTFNNIRTKADFAGRIGEQLIADSSDFVAYFDSSAYFSTLGLNKDNFMTIFIPNTYELYWNTDAEGFVKRMAKEHDNFWTPTRRDKAEKIGLTPEQVYILASIVYSENDKAADEAPRIAGVYMNRINKGMKLEADPTVKFAIGNFAIKRILFADLEIESPYNTYKHVGLPPGPIHMPPIAYIDAVLNYEHHEYIFMCANGDGSGYHLFAKTLAEHNRNRDIYIATLNKQGIRR